jgi:PTH1 family peptidyl-tRNA hydrolase
MVDAEVPDGDRQLRAAVGLGNPGSRYDGTRHNAGVRLLESLWNVAGGGRFREEDGVLSARIVLDGREVFLARPLTFMNNSGPAVACWARKAALEPQGILVLCDDLDLPLGRIRLRRGGGTGGHRGLLSLMEALGDSFPRLRLGIGSPPVDVDPADYVLQTWSSEEEMVWRELLPWATEALRVVFGSGLTAAMNRFNGEPGPPGWSPAGEEGGE